MKLLALDTSMEVCSCAVNIDGFVIEKYQWAPREHANLVLPLIKALLTETKLSFKALDAIAFGCGPGSFTGIRIACAVAKGLAMAHDTPVIPISTLHTLAQGAATKYQASHICVCLDARMQAVYWMLAKKNHQGFVEASTQEKLTAPQKLMVNQPENYIAVGSGFSAYYNLMDARLIKRLIHIEPSFYSRADAIATLAESRWKRGEVKSVEEALPTYLRKSI